MLANSNDFNGLRGKKASLAGVTHGIKTQSCHVFCRQMSAKSSEMPEFLPRRASGRRARMAQDRAARVNLLARPRIVAGRPAGARGQAV